ncbi:MAG: hypothetical protein AAF493_29445 [Pseudomonadota bacterium]
MIDEHAHKKCLKVIGYVFLGVMVLVAGANAIIDPFGLFGAPRVAGFNEHKPAQRTTVRMFKAHVVDRMEPRTLILGSSRAELGLSPQHPGFKAQPVYNLALSSSRMYEIWRYFQHAQSTSTLEEVVLPFDFLMFNGRLPFETGFSEARLRPSAWLTVAGTKAYDLTTALFSLDGIDASRRTLTGQRRFKRGYLIDGQKNLSRKWAQIQRAGGHYAAFLSNLRGSMIGQDGWVLHTDAYPESFGYASPLEPLRELIRFCRANNIRLHLSFSPVHALRLVIIERVGLWEEYEQWKRDITSIVAEENARSAVGPQITLLDFSTLHDIVKEPVPPKGDTTTQMRWFWEGSHFRTVVGNWMLDRILQVKESNAPADFGVELTPSTIEASLATVRAELRRYVAEYPDDVAIAEEALTQTAEERAELERVRERFSR